MGLGGISAVAVCVRLSAAVAGLADLCGVAGSGGDCCTASGGSAAQSAELALEVGAFTVLLRCLE